MTCVQRRPVLKTGSLRLSLREPDCFTSPITTCAWMKRISLQTILPALRMWERTSACMTRPGVTAGNSPHGTRSKGKSCGRFLTIFRCGVEHLPRQETLCSTGRWTDGSKRSMRTVEHCFGNLKLDRELSANPQPIKDRMENNTSPSCLGSGGWAGAIVAGGLDARDESAALGFAGAMKDLPHYTNKGGMLYVFALP